MEQEIAVPFATFELLLTYLLSGAGGVALAHILENFAWFRTMASSHKFWLVLILSIMLPVVAIFLYSYLYGHPIDVDVTYQAIQAAILVFAGSQYAHSIQLKARGPVG